MTCNGHNHAADCQCGFQGGNRGKPRVFVWRSWRKSSSIKLSLGPNANCPLCHKPVYFVPGPRGGGAYFNSLGPPWPKHPCMTSERPYSPYNAKGRPKLRNRPSAFEKDSWFPFFVRHIEQLAVGTIVHGVALNDSTVLHLGVSADTFVDAERPIYVRMTTTRGGELNFFPLGLADPVSTEFFSDCLNEFDLLLCRSFSNRDDTSEQQ